MIQYLFILSTLIKFYTSFETIKFFVPHTTLLAIERFKWSYRFLPMRNSFLLLSPMIKSLDNPYSISAEERRRLIHLESSRKRRERISTRISPPLLLKNVGISTALEFHGLLIKHQPFAAAPMPQTFILRFKIAKSLLQINIQCVFQEDK